MVTLVSLLHYPGLVGVGGKNNFTENYEFLCVGAKDDIHVYVSNKLKLIFSCKVYRYMHMYGLSYVWYIMLRYHMYYTYVWYTYIWVISNPKQLCIVYLGAPGSTHDARNFSLGCYWRYSIFEIYLMTYCYHCFFYS